MPLICVSRALRVLLAKVSHRRVALVVILNARLAQLEPRTRNPTIIPGVIRARHVSMAME